MATSLGALQIGGTDLAYKYYIHTSGTAIASNPRLGNGDGDDTGLVVGVNTIGIHNAAGFVTTFTGLATAARAVSFPDAAGTVMLGDGSGLTDADAFNLALGRKVVTLASEVANSTTTLAAVTGFTFTPAASTSYRFTVYLRLQTAATTNGMDLRLLGPTADHVHYQAFVEYGSDGEDHHWGSSHAAFNDAIAPIGFQTTTPMMRIEGIVKFPSGTPASDLRFEIASETAATEVKVLADSVMIIEKIS